MKKIIKISGLLITILALQFLTTSINTSAKTNEKVYKEYHINTEKSKFPIQLSNSLVIDLKGEINGPRISRNNQTIWQSAGGFMTGSVSFTVTKNNDTYLYYRSGSGGEEMVDVVGVDKNGKVFMEWADYGEGASIGARFLSGSSIEVFTEKYSPYYDGSTASKHSGEYKSKFYQLYVNGTIKELPYFDQNFVTLAKQGRLKSVPGLIGMHYSKLKAVIDDSWANQEIAEVYNFYKSDKGYYGFYHNANVNDRIKSNAQVRGIFRISELHGNRKELRPYF